jgi:hypothetical protein
MAYCIYTGASAIIQDVKSGNLDANSNMTTFLRALQGGLATCPVVQRSLDIINNSLQKPLSSQPRLRSESTGAPSKNYLPAFPNYDPQIDLGLGPNLGTMDLDASTFLDCFPENHIDMETGEWCLPT